MHLKKHFYFIILCLLLICLLPTCFAFETLQEGDKGENVELLKLRMYELGYFSSKNFSDEYNDVTASRVKQLEKINGLDETGIATPELQTLIFSENVKKKNGKVIGKPMVVPTPLPIIRPQQEVVYPPTDDKGFLLDAQEEFVYKNQEDGKWVYKSDTLQVDITRIEDPNQVVLYYETHVFTQGDERMTALLTEGKRPAYTLKKPQTIARENKAVLAISDDFFGYRRRNNMTMGIVIRNGEVFSTKTKRKNASGFPNLQTMAYFEDGTLKTFESDAHTAKEYLEMGATDVLAFGPILVQEGQLGAHMLKDEYYTFHEPRCALGMIEKGHYVILTVKGRIQKSEGVYLTWLADKMLELGATEAINLDGGNTASLVFMGEILNTEHKNTREQTSMLGFGTSDLVVQDD